MPKTFSTGRPNFTKKLKNVNKLFSDHVPVAMNHTTNNNKPLGASKLPGKFWGEIVSFNYSFHIASDDPGKLMFPSEYFAAQKLTNNFTNGMKPHKSFINYTMKHHKNLGIVCVQESVYKRTEEIRKMLNERLPANKSMRHIFNESFITNDKKVSEGISILHRNDYKVVLKDALPGESYTKHNCFGIRGRAIQAAVLKRQSPKGPVNVLVINLHSPNPAVGGDRTKMNANFAKNKNNGGNPQHFLLERLFKKILRHSNKELKAKNNDPVDELLICGDFNDAYPMYKDVPFVYQKPFKVGRFTVGVRGIGSKKPPVTCCAYAKDKVTRLPGDYIYASFAQKVIDGARVTELKPLGTATRGLPIVNDFRGKEFNRNLRGRSKKSQFFYNTPLNPKNPPFSYNAK